MGKVELFKAILTSTKKDPVLSAQLIKEAIQSTKNTTPVEILTLLKQELEIAIEKGQIQGGLANSSRVKIELALDAKSPKNIVK